MNEQHTHGESNRENAQGHGAAVNHSGKHFGTWSSWSSWNSPVGRGLFYFLTALAFWIALNALITLAGVIVSLAERHDDSAMMMDYQNMQPSGGPSVEMMPR